MANTVWERNGTVFYGDPDGSWTELDPDGAAQLASDLATTAGPNMQAATERLNNATQELAAAQRYAQAARVELCNVVELDAAANQAREKRAHAEGAAV